jgi:hypothetical protein
MLKKLRFLVIVNTTYERLERVEIEKRKPVETGSLEDERGSSYRP